MSGDDETKTDPKELLRQIRHRTQTWLNEGASSRDLAASLTYVAAEMSFQLALNPLLAISVMFASIAKAASLHEQQSQGDARGHKLRLNDQRRLH